jgi:hypothetical protein
MARRERDIIVKKTHTQRTVVTFVFDFAKDRLSSERDFRRLNVLQKIMTRLLEFFFGLDEDDRMTSFVSDQKRLT